MSAASMLWTGRILSGVFVLFMLERFLLDVSRMRHRGIPKLAQIRFETFHLTRGDSDGQRILE